MPRKAVKYPPVSCPGGVKVLHGFLHKKAISSEMAFKMVRPTGIELVSSAPQADTLSIELWAQKKDICNAELLTTFLF